MLLEAVRLVPVGALRAPRPQVRVQVVGLPAVVLQGRQRCQAAGEEEPVRKLVEAEPEHIRPGAPHNRLTHSQCKRSKGSLDEHS